MSSTIVQNHRYIVFAFCNLESQHSSRVEQAGLVFWVRSYLHRREKSFKIGLATR